MNRTRFQGHVIVLVAMLFFAFNLPAIKSLFLFHFSVGQIVLLKILSGALFFGTFTLFVEPERVSLRDHFGFALNGVIGIFLLHYFLIKGLSLTSVVDSSIIFSFSPVLMVLVSVGFRKRLSIGSGEFRGLAVGIALLILIYSFTGIFASRTLGNLYVLLCTLSFVLFLKISYPIVLRYQSVTVLKWSFLWAVVVSVVFFFKDLMSLPSIRALYFPEVQIAFLFVFVFPVVLFYFLLFISFRRLPLGSLGWYSYAVAPVASFISIGTGQSALEWNQPIAELVILSSTFLFLYVLSKRGSRKIRY